MDSLLDKNLITTREASELSGYHSDYLGRLSREGKISASRVGRSWVIDRSSLLTFVAEQEAQKKKNAEELARAREEEYRAVQATKAPVAPSVLTVVQAAPIVAEVPATIPSEVLAAPVPSPYFSGRELREKMVATLVALLAINIGLFAGETKLVEHGALVAVKTLENTSDIGTHALATAFKQGAGRVAAFRIGEEKFGYALLSGLEVGLSVYKGTILAAGAGIASDETIAFAEGAGDGFARTSANSFVASIVQGPVGFGTVLIDASHGLLDAHERAATGFALVSQEVPPRLISGFYNAGSEAFAFAGSVPARIKEHYERATYAWVDSSQDLAMRVTRAELSLGTRTNAAADSAIALLTAPADSLTGARSALAALFDSRVVAPSPSAGLAAASASADFFAPARSLALFTYETVNAFFARTSATLAMLFSPTVAFAPAESYPSVSGVTTVIESHPTNTYISNFVTNNPVSYIYSGTGGASIEYVQQAIDRVRRDIGRHTDNSGSGSTGLADLSGSSIEELADVATMTKSWGDLFLWNGSEWTNVATSSLGIGAGTGSPGGALGTVQFNSAGLFAGDAAFTFNAAAGRLSVNFASTTGISSAYASSTLLRAGTAFIDSLSATLATLTNLVTTDSTTTNATSTNLAVMNSFALGSDRFSDLTGAGLTASSGALAVDDVTPSMLQAADFGAFTCNGTNCALDASTVSDTQINFGSVTLADFTNDAGFLTSAVTSIGPGGALQSGPAITFATSSTAWNGLTASTTITGAGNTITFANTLSGRLGVAGGGTGTSTAPSYGQLLVGDGAGGYALVATSSLGISGGGGTPGGSNGQIQFNNSGAFAGSASLTFDSTSGRISANYASTTGLSSVYASSTNLFAGNLTLGALSGILKASSGVVSVATAGVDYLTSAITSIGPAGQGQTGASITLATSTSGTDFTITAAGNAITFNLPSASATARGVLTASDWNVFNNKVSSTSLSATTPLAYNSGTGAFTIQQATTGQNGYLSSTDFNTFNTKISSTSLSGGTGISYNSSSGVITNTAPDQTVTLTAGSGISVSGSYPGFTIANTGLLSYDAFSHPSAGVFATTSGAIFSASSTIGNGQGAGGLTISGNATTTGNARVGSLTVANITGSTQCLHVDANGNVTGTGSDCGSGSGSINAIGPAGQTQNGSTITFATSTSGTDFTITGAGNTLTFNIPSASSVARGLLSIADWNVFNNKISSTSLSGGTGISYNSGTGVISNTGVTSVQQTGGGAAQTGAITFATSSDTNLGLSITNTGGAFTFTPTWSGTLAAGRLNANVVQGVTNDTNITGSISAQNLTLGWTGQLSVARGGTGWGAIQAGAIPYGNGTGALATTTQGTGGFVLAWLNGVPTWTSTSSISNGLSSIGPAGSLQSGPAITFATSSTAFNGLTASTTITASGNTITFANTLAGRLGVAGGGTGVSTFTSGQLLYGNGTNALSSVATTTFTPSAEFTTTGTIGALIGGANSTLGLANNGVALGKLAQIAANTILGNATGATGNVTAIATSTLFGTGTGGQVLTWNNGVPTFVATTTYSAPLVFASGNVTITQSGTGANGYLSSTDFNTFNNKISSTSLSGASVIGYNSGTGVITTTGGTFGSGDYIFPNKVTSPYASSTAFSAPYASSTNLFAGNLTLGALSGILKASSGVVSVATAGVDYLTSAITSIGPAGQGQTGASITLATSTSGTDFTITAAGNAITFNLPSASATARGVLTASDWNVFNNKISSTSLSGGAGISYNSGTGVITNTGVTSVTNSDGSLTVSPTTGSVAVSLNLSNANVWTGKQTFGYASSTGFSSAYASSTNAFFGGLSIASLNGPLQANNGVVSATTSIGAIYGGTGQTGYSVGDLLYADSGTSLARLPVSTNGLVLKLVGGVPSWQPDLTTGGGGGAGAWSTTTDSLAIYPSDTSDVIIVGASATTTTNSIFEVFGRSYFSNTIGIATTSASSLFKLAVQGSALLSGNLSVANFVATGTASVGSLTLNGENFTDLTGAGLTNTGGALTLDTSGDWTGTFDGAEGSYYLANAFSTTSARYFTNQYQGATTTVSCSGGTSCTGFVAFGSSPITISSTAGLSAYDAFTHPAAGQSATTSLMLFNGAASSTQLSATLAYFGGTGTTSISSTGALTTPSLTIGSLTGLLKGTGGLVSAATPGTDYVAGGAGAATTTLSTSGVLSFTANPVVFGASPISLSITQSGTGASGYLSQTDFNTFNNKISSTSLSGASVISYNSGTGVITTTGGTFGAGSYVFPGSVTAPYASSTAFSSAYASSTNAFFGTLSIGNLSGVLKATAGLVSAATAGVDYENPLSFVYPIVRSVNSISLAFGTTTQNFWSAYNNFSSLFATNASSTNATTTNLHITSASNSGLATDASGRVYSAATTTAGTGLTYSGNAFSVNTSQNIATLSNLTSNGLIKTSGGTGALSIATPGTDYIAGGAGAATTTLSTSGVLSLSANPVVFGSSPITLSITQSGTGASGYLSQTDFNTFNNKVSSSSLALVKDWFVTTNIFGQSALAPTTTQNIAVNGTGTSTVAGGIEAWRSISAPYFVATGTAATSTLMGGLIVDTNTLVADYSSGRVGVGTASPGAKLEVFGGSIKFMPTGGATDAYLGIEGATATNYLILQTRRYDNNALSRHLAINPEGGNVSVGTTTAYSKLTAWGTGSLFEAVTNASSTVFSIGQNGATTTAFAISGIPSALLKTNANGSIIPAVAGTDYIAGGAGAATTTLSGNSQITLSQPVVIFGSSPSTLSITADSIGDTQLAFNTGQNLTTASTPTFGGLTLTNALTVPNGGTGWGNIQAGAIPYGNGTGALATTTQGTGGFVLAWLNGIPTWVATSSINNGITAIGPTGQQVTSGAVTLASSTTGTDFTITGSGNTLTFNLPSASASNRGLLTSGDWSTFQNKISSTSLSGASVISYNSGTGVITTTGGTFGAGNYVFPGSVTAPYASSTALSSAYASSTNAFFGNLSIGTLTGLLKATAGVVSTATAGVDYENPLSFVYPIIRSVNSISLAFGTTTQNFWSAYNNFGSLFATNASSTNATTTNLHITSASNGGLATDANGRVYSAATTTAGTGLTYSGNAFNVNTSQNIATLSNLTSNGLIKTSGGTGALSIATPGTDYIAGGAGAATTTLTISGPFTTSATPVVFGSSPITATYYGLATTSTLTSSQLLVSNGAAGVYGVSTTSATINNGLTGTLTTLGSGQTIGLAAIAANTVLANGTGGSAVPTAIATSTFFGTGTGGQVLTWNNGVPQWVATTTYANGTGISTSFTAGQLTITNTGVTSLTAGDGITVSAGTGAVTVNNPFAIATTSGIAVSQIPYYTQTGGKTTIGGVATSTRTYSAEFTNTGTLGAQIGGSNAVVSLATNGVALTKLAQIAANTILGNNTGATGNVTAFATSTLFGTGTGGQVLTWANGVPTFVATTTFSSPLVFASGNVTINNAAADGATKGAASFATNDFDASSGNITLDYTNGQKASASVPGFLAAADYTTFQNKISSTSLSAAFPLVYNSATGAFTFNGLSTSTAAVVGNIPYFSGANTFANVATSSVTSGTGISFIGTPGALVGGTALTITNTGVTSLAGTANQITASASTGAVTLSIPSLFSIQQASTTQLSSGIAYFGTTSTTTIRGNATSTFSGGINLASGGCFAIGGNCIGVSGSSGTVNTGAEGYFAYYPSAGTTVDDQTALFLSSAGNIGVGSNGPTDYGAGVRTLAIDGSTTGRLDVASNGIVQGSIYNSGSTVRVGNINPNAVALITDDTEQLIIDGAGNVTISSLGNGLVKSTSGVLSNATAGVDYENPLSFVYPLVRTVNSISLAFGTTTANSWNAQNTFTGIFATNASSTNATTSSLYITGLTSGGLAVDGNGQVYKGATTTAGTGLTYSGNAFNVNTSQNISTLSNLTSNGLIKTTGGTGALSIATPGTDYIAGGAGAATTSLSISGGILSLSANPIVFGSSPITLSIAQAGTGASGYLSQTDFNTFNNKISSTSLSATFPLAYNSSTGAFTFNGLSTSTAAVVGNIPYFSGANTFANVATSTRTYSAEFSNTGTLGYQIGGSNAVVSLATNGVALTKLAQIAANTILGNATGATGNVTAFATSSLFAAGTAGNVLTYTSAGTWVPSATTTAGTGLSYSGNAFNVNTSQNISTLSNLTSNGLIKTSGGTGALSIATPGTDYIAGGAGAATTTYTVSGPFTTSATPVVFGSSPITATYYGLATTSALTSSQLLVSNGAAGVYGVSTTSATINNGLTGTLTTLGSGQTIGLAAIAANTVLANATGGSAVPTAVATSTFFGTGTGGQVLTWNNGVPQWVATTTYANGTGISTSFTAGQLTITNTGVTSLTAGDGITVSAGTGAVTVNNPFAIATTSGIAVSQIPYYTQTGGKTTIGGVATTTLVAGTNVSFSGGTPVIIGSSPVTINAASGGLSSYDAWTHPAAGQSATTSLMLFNGAASSTQLSSTLAYFGGTGTTTISSTGALTTPSLTIGSLTGILKGTNGLVSAATAGTDYIAGGAGAATTTLTISGPFNTSATPVVFGSSPITSTYYGLATTTTLTASGVLYSSNGAAGVASAATSTLSVGNGLTTTSGALGFQIGGSNASIGLAAIAANTVLANATGGSAVPTAVATSTFFGTGTGGQVLTWNNGVPQWVATTTYSAPLVFSGGNLTITQSGTGANGYLSSTDFNTFNNKISSTSLSGASVISYNSGTGVITTTPGTFAGSGTYTFPAGVVAPYASSTAFSAGYASSTNAFFGTVGIGASSPMSRLAIVATTTATTSQSQIRLESLGTGNIATGNLIGGIDFVSHDSQILDPNGIVSASIQAVANRTHTDTLVDTDLVFSNVSNTGTTLTEFMRITGTDPKLGIGSTSPLAKLTVVGKSSAANNRTFGLANSNNVDTFYVQDNGYAYLSAALGIGTTTPQWALTIASSTKPQLTLSDGSLTSAPYNFRSINGNFYLSTSSPTTFATSSVSALSINTNSDVTISHALSVYGSGATGSTVLFDVGSGQFTVNPNGVAIGGDQTPDAMLEVIGGQLLLSSDSSAGNNGNRLSFDSASGFNGIGTTTPRWALTVSSSTAPQLTLTDGSATAAPFNLRANGSYFTFSTSSPTTFATTTSSLFSLNSATGSTTALKFDVTGTATSTFNGGLFISSGGLTLGSSLNGILKATNGAITGTVAGTDYVAGGTGSTNQLAYFTGTGAIAGDAGFTVDATADRLTMTYASTTAISGTAGLFGFVRAGGSASDYNEFGNNGTSNYWSSVTDPAGIFTGGSERLTILVTGNVGVGSTTPGYKLGVFGSASFGSSVSVTRRADFDTAGALTVFTNNNAMTRPITLANYGVTAAAQGLSISAVNASTTPFADANSYDSGYMRFISEGDYTSLATQLTGIAFGTQNGTQQSLERVRISAAGNLGVGTTSPWGQLSVNPNALGSGVPEFVVGSSTATHFVVTGAGNVGIGTSSPYARLSVAGSAVFGGFSGGSISLNNGAASDAYLYFDGALHLAKNGTGDRITILDGGNVGIGSTTPWKQLSVGSSNTGTFAISTSTAGCAAFSAFGELYSTGSACGGTGSQTPWTSNIDGGGFTLTNTSKIGVGTTSPWATLAVNPVAGGASNQFVVGSSTATAFLINNSGNVGVGSLNPAVRFEVKAGASNSNILSVNATDGGGLASIFSDGSENAWLRLFDTNANENVRLNSSGTSYLSGGAVGIGSTSPWATLAVNPTAGVASNQFVVGSSTATAFVINNAGQVAIGTSTVTTGAMLQLYSNNTSGANPAIVIGGNLAGDTDFWIGRTNDNDSVNDDSLQIGTGLLPGTSPVITFNYNGNTGIAATAPKTALQVSTSTTAGSIPTAGNFNGASLYITNSDPNYGTLLGVLGTGTGYLQQQRTDGAGTTYPFLLNPNGGAIGVGTTSPWATFAVNPIAGGASNQFVVGSSTATNLVVTNSGALGLGTSTPTTGYRLSVVGNSLFTTSNPSLTLENTSAAQWTLQNIDADSRFRIFGGAAERFSITSTGNVGIGSSTPYATLSVNPIAGAASAQFVVGSSTATNLAVTNAGNVAIGAANPSFPTKLIVVGTSGEVSATPYGNSQVTITNAGEAGLSIHGASGSASRIFFGTTGASGNTMGRIEYNNNSTGSLGSMAFVTDNTEKMRITGAGTVGIGTTTPAFSLHVASSTKAQLTLSDASLTSAPFNFRAINNALYISTSSPSTFATTTSSVLSINSATGSTTLQKLSVTGLVSCDTVDTDSQGNFVCGTDSGGGGSPAGSGTELQYRNGASFGAVANTAYDGTTLTLPSLVSFGSSRATTTIANNLTSAWTLATSSTAGIPLISVDTTTNAEKVTIGVPGGDVHIGITGSTANLVFENSSSINAKGSGTLTLGTTGDIVNSAVKFAVGSTSPWAAFSIGSTTVNGTAPSFAVQNNATTSFAVFANGKVGIGTTTSATATTSSVLLIVGNSKIPTGQSVAVFGTANAIYCFVKPGTGVSCTSDARYKKNVATLVPALDFVDQLRPVTYNWKGEEDTDPTHAGFIAQEVQQLAPDLISTEANGQLTMNYAGLTPYLTSAIQQISGALNIRGALTGTSTLKSLYAGTTTAAISVDSQGRVGVGTTTPNHTLDVYGDIAAISFVNTSTKTAKTNISYLDASSTEDILTQIGNLRIAEYRYKMESKNNPLRLGLIAEEAPVEVLSLDGKGVDIYKLSTFTLAGVQALASHLNATEIRVDSLEDRLAALEAASATGGALSLTSLTDLLHTIDVYVQKGIAQVTTLVGTRWVAAADSAGNSSAGSGTVLAGNTVVEITNPYATATSQVFITMTAPVTGNWYLSDKADGSFRVHLAEAQAADVTFDYFIVQTKGQIATSTPDYATTTPYHEVGHSTSIIIINPDGTTTTILGTSTPPSNAGTTTPPGDIGSSTPPVEPPAAPEPPSTEPPPTDTGATEPAP